VTESPSGAEALPPAMGWLALTMASRNHFAWQALMQHPRRPVHSFAFVTLAMLAMLALTGSAGAATSQVLESTSALGFETVKLPRGEHMGLIGGAYLFDIGSDWRLGPAVYAAATGERGGLFVGGAELRRQWALGRSVRLAAGFYAGGGGGAAAPVGGGLMLRPSVALLGDVLPGMQAGLSWSQVRFPSGDIHSQQFGLLFQWRSQFRHFTDPKPGDTVGAGSGLGLDDGVLSVMQYRFNDAGARHIGLVGARAQRRADGPLHFGIEAAAAAQGDAAGYMEVLGTVSAGTDLLPGWRVGLRAAAGLGGGGAVPTAGGVIGKMTGTASWQFTPGWRVGADLGMVRALHGGMQARQVGAWLGTDLEPASGSPGHLVRTEWTAVLQHHSGIARADGTSRGLDTIGLKLDRYLGDSLYVTGQAHSAYAGGAGAYSVGLLGLGYALPVAPGWRAGVEALVGAAGGGGVKTGGGAIGQGVAWAGWTPGRNVGEWRLGLGARRPLRSSGGNTGLVELAWSRHFELSGR
jgi:hypothetical protein